MSQKLSDILTKVPLDLLWAELDRRVCPVTDMHRIHDTVADHFGVLPLQMRFSPPNTRSVTPARFAAMMLMHRMLGVTWEQAGKYYGLTLTTSLKTPANYSKHHDKDETYRARVAAAELELARTLGNPYAMAYG